MTFLLEVVMSRYARTLVVLLMLMTGSLTAFAQVAGARDLEVTSVTLSADQRSVTITGDQFGSAPIVTLAGQPLAGARVNGSGTLITVSIPALAPGSYALTVSKGNAGLDKNVDEFVLTIGAIGPRGVQGPQGPVGPTGPQGATGAK